MTLEILSRRSRFARVAAPLAGIIIALAVFELGLRWIRWRPFVEDPNFGLIPKPGSTAHWHTEGDGISNWSVLGVRRGAPPRPDVPSILALGDSFTESLMVDDVDVYTHIVETNLSSPEAPVQVLNAGRSSMAVADYIHHRPWYERTFHPRWTMIQVRDSDFEEDTWKRDASHGAFVVDPDAGLTVVGPALPPTSPARSLMYRVREASSILAYGQNRWQLLRLAAAKEPPLFRGGQVSPPATPAGRVEYPIEEELRMLFQAWDERLTIVYLAKFDVDHPLKPTDTETRVAQECAKHGWSFVSSRADHADFSRRHASPNGFSNTHFNEGHMNREGHSALAQQITAELRRLTSDAVF